VNVLVVDVGGTTVKILATGQDEPQKFASGPTLGPDTMVTRVKELARSWSYDVVAIGYPGPVLRDRPVAEPPNLAPGWVGFDYPSAFGRPVKIINDAAMQALGSFKGGKMLFLWSWAIFRIGGGPTRTTWASAVWNDWVNENGANASGMSSPAWWPPWNPTTW
jgi:hypothetical protein